MRGWIRKFAKKESRKVKSRLCQGLVSNIGVALVGRGAETRVLGRSGRKRDLCLGIGSKWLRRTWTWICRRLLQPRRRSSRNPRLISTPEFRAKDRL